MKNIFIGRVLDENNQVLHEHFAESSDDTFYVQIWRNEDKPTILGEFRKFHHLEKLIEKEHPSLKTERYEGSISIPEMIKLIEHF